MKEPLVVEELAEGGCGDWRSFVERSPGAMLFHDVRWLDAVKTAYRYREFRLLARRRGVVVGVLPLTLVASPLLGRSLISAAFAVGGGIVSDDDEASRALADLAVDIGRRHGVNYVELRGGAAPGEDYEEKTGLYASFARELPAAADDVLASLPRNRRAEVRKSLAAQQSGEISHRIVEDPEAFYRLYAAALRALGTPVMPRKFLEALKTNFGADAEIAIVEHHGEAIAGLMSFWRGDRVMPYYIGGGPKAREFRAYDFLYYSLMRRAVEKGVRIFDFGRSKMGSTHFATKTYWGFEPAPVLHHVALVRAKKAPNVSPANPKFRGLVSIWRRLPLPVANALGPIVARNFP